MEWLKMRLNDAFEGAWPMSPCFHDIDRQRMEPCHVGKAEHWFRQCPVTMSLGTAGDVGAEFKG